MANKLLIGMCLFCLAAISEAQEMPINWTHEYAFNLTPEQNGFTRTSQGYNSAATVNLVTTGGPSNRRVDIDASNPNSGMVFITSTIPALDSSVGITAEMMVAVSGSEQGDAGIELTFLDYQILFTVYPNRINIYAPHPVESLNVDIDTPSNSTDTLWRILFYPNHTMSVYRAGSLIFGPTLVPSNQRTFQRVLWWAESGVTASFKAMRYYIGGAVEP